MEIILNSFYKYKKMNSIVDVLKENVDILINSHRVKICKIYITKDITTLCSTFINHALLKKNQYY